METDSEKLKIGDYRRYRRFVKKLFPWMPIQASLAIGGAFLFLVYLGMWAVFLYFVVPLLYPYGLNVFLVLFVIGNTIRLLGWIGRRYVARNSTDDPEATDQDRDAQETESSIYWCEANAQRPARAQPIPPSNPISCTKRIADFYRCLGKDWRPR